jgi:hypothetical protein
MINKQSKIMLRPTVIYTDGITEQFEAIRITKKKVVIGRIIDGKFVTCGFIHQRNIKNIINGGKRN